MEDWEEWSNEELLIEFKMATDELAGNGARGRSRLANVQMEIARRLDQKGNMDNDQAVGYMLLACKEIGKTRKEAGELLLAMLDMFARNTEKEAQRNAAKWFFEK